MLLEKNDVLLLTGDSVTDCGRSRDFDDGGRDNVNGMGAGYPMLVKAYLNAMHPELNLTVINKGVSGDRTCDVLARMEEDHLRLKPNVVTLLIGINDVWRHFDSPSMRQIDAEEYAANMDRLIAELKTTAREVVVITPFQVKPADEEPMYKMALAYAEIAKAAAKKAGVHLIDAQAVFDEKLAGAAAKLSSADTVHPTINGHVLLADAIVKLLA